MVSNLLTLAFFTQHKGFEIQKFPFLWNKCPRSAIAGPHGKGMFSFLGNSKYFPEWLYPFTFPPATHETFSFPASLPTFDVATTSHSGSAKGVKCLRHHELICISLVAKDAGCFHMLTCHPYILFHETSLDVFGPFANWIGSVCFLLLSFDSSLPLLSRGPLPGVWFANTFSQSAVCLFVFLRGSFHGTKVLNFKEI